jgi:hypothetical protein
LGGVLCGVVYLIYLYDIALDSTSGCPPGWGGGGVGGVWGWFGDGESEPSDGVVIFLWAGFATASQESVVAGMVAREAWEGEALDKKMRELVLTRKGRKAALGIVRQRKLDEMEKARLQAKKVGPILLIF